MTFKNYLVERKGKEYHLVRVISPRISITVNLSRDLAEVKEIVIIDDCTAKELAKILIEIEEFIQTCKDNP